MNETLELFVVTVGVWLTFAVIVVWMDYDNRHGG